jgi:hypothetical protein
MFLTLLLFRGIPLMAQDTVPGKAQSDYRLDADGRIRQRLSWSRSNAYGFEVEIERQAGPALWEPAGREQTSELFIEVSLPPGQYRYRVLSYNVLGRVAAVSEWVGMRIFVARQPVVESLNPGSYYFDKPSGSVTLILFGTDLSDEAEIYLAEKAADNLLTAPLAMYYSEDERSIRVVFPTAGLGLAPYEIVITNPGGLQARVNFSAGFSSALDIPVSLGYSPALPLYGYVFDSFSKPFYPAGLYGRLGIVPFKRLWGFLGAELTPRFLPVTTETDNYRVNGTMLALTLSGLYQYRFRDHTMALNLRLGAGAAAILGISYEHREGLTSEEVEAAFFLVSAGASFQWDLWRGLFLEAGLDYVQGISPNTPPPGFVQFNAGAGWKF